MTSRLPPRRAKATSFAGTILLPTGNTFAPHCQRRSPRCVAGLRLPPRPSAGRAQDFRDGGSGGHRPLWLNAHGRPQGWNNGSGCLRIAKALITDMRESRPPLPLSPTRRQSQGVAYGVPRTTRALPGQWAWREFRSPSRRRSGRRLRWAAAVWCEHRHVDNRLTGVYVHPWTYAPSRGPPMNRRQWVALCMGGLIFVGTLIYPPWVCSIRTPRVQAPVRRV